MILSENLSYEYTNEKTLKFPDLRCEASSPLLLLGNSGTGKTTLLHLLGLLLSPKSGTITMNGTITNNLSAAEATKFRAENIGIIFQKSHFVSALSALDNLLITNYLSNKKIQKEKAIALAQELGFETLLAKKTYELSGGEQQRLSIARALMNTPKVILADEPTSNLDNENCHKVIDLLTQQAQNINASLIIVTHDQRLTSVFKNQVWLEK